MLVAFSAGNPVDFLNSLGGMDSNAGDPFFVLSCAGENHTCKTLTFTRWQLLNVSTGNYIYIETLTS